FCVTCPATRRSPPMSTLFPYTTLFRSFPLRLSFAMTINKSQGQTLEKVGLQLEYPVFSHGQLYVGMSRVKERKNLKICSPSNKTDRKSTRLNSSHVSISYAVFCLKKKK